MGWVTDESYPKKGKGVSHPTGGVYPTLHHMDDLVKQVDLQFYGIRIMSHERNRAQVGKNLY
jgi:hypothetical protein